MAKAKQTLPEFVHLLRFNKKEVDTPEGPENVTILISKERVPITDILSGKITFNPDTDEIYAHRFVPKTTISLSEESEKEEPEAKPQKTSKPRGRKPKEKTEVTEDVPVQKPVEEEVETIASTDDINPFE